MLIRDGSLEEAVSLQKSVAEAKTVVYGDPSEQAAASYQLMGSIRLKQGRTQQALKWLTKVTPSFNLCSSLFIGALGLVTIIYQFFKLFQIS